TTTIGGATTLTGALGFTGSALTVNAAVTAGGAVTVVNAGTFTTSAAGDITAAGAFNQTGAGANSLAGDITLTLASAALSLAKAVTLTGNVVFGTTDGAITFTEVVDGAADNAQSLTLNAVTGDVTFAKAVGVVKKLGDTVANSTGTTKFQDVVLAKSVATNAGGFTELFGNVTTTGGAQTYADSKLKLKSDIVLTGTTVTVGTVEGETHALTVTGNAQLGTAGGSDTISGLTSLEVSGTAALDVASITSTGAQTYTGAVTLGQASVLTGAGIKFVSTLNGAKALTITDTATTTFGGAVGGTTRLTSLLVNGTGTTRISGGVVKTDGTQTYSNAVELRAATTLTGSMVSFLNTVLGDDGTNKFALNVVGNAILGDSISTTDAITGLASLDVTGTTLIETAALTSAGGQRFRGAVTVGAATTLTTTDNAVTFDAALSSSSTEQNSLTIAAGSGNILVQGPVGGSVAAEGFGDLIFNTTGTKTFGSTIQAVSLTTQGVGIVNLGGNVTTSAAQTYNSNVVLTSNVTLRGTNISIQGDVDSDATAARSLTIFATDFALSGGFGANRRLLNLAIDAANGISLNGAITTDGTQTYDGIVTLTGNTTLIGTDIALNRTVKSGNSASALTVTGSGVTTFAGTVGAGAASNALSSLTVNGAVTGTTLLNGGSVTTIGAQDFRNAVTLGGDTVLTTTNGDVSFGMTVNSSEALSRLSTPAALTVTAGSGAVTFTGIVG
ncbi:hypothetical protein, partial [Sphingorhabdus rigui]